METNLEKNLKNSLQAMAVKRLYINSYRMTADHGYSVPAEHAHEYYEMVFNFSPIPIRYTVSGHTYETDTAGISFRAPYVLHSIYTEQRYVRTMMAFHPCLLEEYSNVLDLGRLRGIQDITIPRTEEEMNGLHQILSRMQTIWRTDKNEKALICLLGALLHEVSALVPDERPDLLSAPSYIQEILHYVVEHLEEKLSADALSKKFFVGKTKLSADFHAVTRMTLHEYVTAVRVSRAKYWITQDIPLSIIAERCGFSQDASFIAMFRRETGMTPGQWREQNRI